MMSVIFLLSHDSSMHRHPTCWNVFHGFLACRALCYIRQV